MKNKKIQPVSPDLFWLLKIDFELKWTEITFKKYFDENLGENIVRIAEKQNLKN